MTVTLEDILKRIETADDYEIERIMDAVRSRFAAAFPDWDVLYISCPKNDREERKRTMDYLLHYFQSTDQM